MLQVLVGIVVPEAVFPSWKVNLLHSSVLSTYTAAKNGYLNFKPVGVDCRWKNVPNWDEDLKFNMLCKKGTISIQKTVLCCPVFNPQMTGGTLPPGPVTEKVSVRHWVAVETLFPNPVFTTTPLSSNSIDVVVVLGPAITKLLKSNRTWKKLSGRKQMGAKSKK